LYKVKEWSGFNLEISCSDELEGRRVDSRNGKSADYLVEFFKRTM
jgi:hypothetical protein